MLSLKKSLNILKKTNALLEGHFILSSGLHSSKYIQCAKLMSFPYLADEICKSLARKNKKIGYLHIQGMNWSSFLEFERELFDVGYEQGGHQMLPIIMMKFPNNSKATILV